MSKLITFFIVVCTIILVFFTSLVGVFFIQGYFKAIENQDLISEVKNVELMHSKYLVEIHNRHGAPIKEQDFDKIDESIFSLAQEQGLTAYGVSKDEHILKENSNNYLCQLNLYGELDNIKSFVNSFLGQDYMVSIDKIEIQADSGKYMAKIKYYLYKETNSER